LLRGEERFDESVVALKQGLVMDHEAGNLYNVLGAVYSQQGRHADAIAAERQQVALSPREANALDSLGLTYLWAGRFGEAEEAYLQALRLKPDFHVAAKHLAVLYYRVGRYHDAIHALEQYLQAPPSLPEKGEAYLYLAWCWKQSGDVPKALVALSRAAETYPDKAALSTLLAMWRGDISSAEELMPQLSVEEKFENRGARAPEKRFRSYLRGQYFLARNQPREAVAAFRDALSHWTWWADINTYDDCLGDALLQMGRTDEATAEYERVLRASPGTPLTHYRLASAYRKKGFGDRAADQFRQFLELWKNADSGIVETRAAREFLRN
jgi:tetratricopeptide (TPR) repeat protein